ncbi:MAG: hypothetical protein ACPGUD_03185 [Parashewanella sp.]
MKGRTQRVSFQVSSSAFNLLNFPSINIYSKGEKRLTENTKSIIASSISVLYLIQSYLSKMFHCNYGNLCNKKKLTKEIQLLIKKMNVEHSDHLLFSTGDLSSELTQYLKNTNVKVDGKSILDYFDLLSENEYSRKSLFNTKLMRWNLDLALKNIELSTQHARLQLTNIQQTYDTTVNLLLQLKEMRCGSSESETHNMYFVYKRDYQ